MEPLKWHLQNIHRDPLKQMERDGNQNEIPPPPPNTTAEIAAEPSSIGAHHETEAQPNSNNAPFTAENSATAADDGPLSTNNSVADGGEFNDHEQDMMREAMEQAVFEASQNLHDMMQFMLEDVPDADLDMHAMQPGEMPEVVLQTMEQAVAELVEAEMQAEEEEEVPEIATIGVAELVMPQLYIREPQSINLNMKVGDFCNQIASEGLLDYISGTHVFPVRVDPETNSINPLEMGLSLRDSGFVDGDDIYIIRQPFHGTVCSLCRFGANRRIVGTRYHRCNNGLDLCEEHFLQLPPEIRQHYLALNKPMYRVPCSCDAGNNEDHQQHILGYAYRLLNHNFDLCQLHYDRLKDHPELQALFVELHPEDIEKIIEFTNENIVEVAEGPDKELEDRILQLVKREGENDLHSERNALGLPFDLNPNEDNDVYALSECPEAFMSEENRIKYKEELSLDLQWPRPNI